MKSLGDSHIKLTAVILEHYWKGTRISFRWRGSFSPSRDTAPKGVPLVIFGGGFRLGSPNPDAISDNNVLPDLSS